jgi:Putative peptidoglycan binding domain
MCAHFPRIQRLISCSLILLFVINGFAADKKKTSATESKVRDKSAVKSDTKQQAKNANDKKNDSKKEKSEKSKSQTVQNKKDDHPAQSLKSKSDLISERSTKKSQKKDQLSDKTGSRQPESKLKQDKVEAASKNEKVDKQNVREEKMKEKSKEVAVSVEKKVKPLKIEKPEIAKLVKKPLPIAFDDLVQERTAIKELPQAGKFQFHPVVKVSPKVQLNFGISNALAAAAYEPPPPVTQVDIIEVYESGSAETQVLEEIRRQEIARLSANPIPNVSNKKIDLKKMDQERITQIQEALFKRGYFVGTPTGTYDELTVQAMRKFQEDHRVDVTGYPTAQSLKLLGLVDYEPRFE